MAEQAGLQKEFNDLQKLVQGNVVTEERANTIYQGLMQKQQALEEKKNGIRKRSPKRSIPPR